MTKPNTPQTIGLAYPGENYILTGTRAWGKDHLEYFLIARKAHACPGRRIMFSRLTDQALRAPWTAFQTFLSDAGIPFEPNEANREIKVYDAVVVFGPNPTEAYFNTTWRGSSFVMICLSEFSSGDSALALKLLSCLRDSQYPTSLVIDGNATGPSAYLLDKWAIQRAAKLPMGQPFVIPELGGLTFINIHASYRDNEFIDPVQYRMVLAAACGGEESLHFKREEAGIYGLAEGTLFVYDDRHRIRMPSGTDWSQWPDFHVTIGIDHGSTSPFAAVFIAEALNDAQGPDSNVYPMGSRLIVGCATSALKDAGWTKANPHTIQQCARLIADEWERLSSGPIPVGYIDSQVAQFHGAQAGPILTEWQSLLPVKTVVKRPISEGCAQIRELCAGSQLPRGQGRPSGLAPLGIATLVFDDKSPRVKAGLYVDSVAAEYIDFVLSNLEAHPIDGGERPSPRSRPLFHGFDALRYGLNPKGSNHFALPTKRRSPVSSSQALNIDSIRHGISGRHALDIDPRSLQAQRERAQAMKRNLGMVHPDVTGKPAPAEQVANPTYNVVSIKRG